MLMGGNETIMENGRGKRKAMGEFEVSLTLLCLNIANVFLHSLGFYLTLFLHKNGLKGAQQLYLIHLSVCELIMNILEMLRRLCHLIPFTPHTHQYAQHVQYYIMIVLYTGITPVFHAILIFLTVDRLLTVALSLKYSAFWDEGRAHRLVIGTWAVGLLSCVCVGAAYHEYNFNWKNIFFKFVFPMFEILFPILASITYSKLFNKHRKSYRMSRQVRHCRARRNAVRKVTTGLRVFWKSRFIISVNIIVCFVLFRLAPTFVYMVSV